jgi:uncharacterized membrane protein HdeD (DUF308 family)/predicted MFS family arabinose efflux permease
MVGKQRVFGLALTCLAAGAVLSAVASSLAVMLIGRVIQGVGGGVLALSSGIARDEFPSEKVAHGIGGMAAAVGIGAGVGLVLSGPITETLGYTWLFWLPAIVATVTAVAVVLVVPASPVRMPGRVGLAAPVLLSAWLVAFLLAVSRAPAWGWGSTKVLGLVAIAAMLALAWVRVELRSETPLIDMRMMRLPAVWTGNTVILLLGAGAFAGFGFIPQFVQTDPGHGYGFNASITESGLIMLPMAIGGFLSGAAAGPLARRCAMKWLLVSGCLVSVAAFVVLVLSHEHLSSVLLAIALMGWGTGVVYAVMPAVIIRAVPAGQTGVATGMNSNIRTIGGAIGAAVMSTIVTSSAGPDGIPTEAGYSRGFAMIALIFVLAALACLLIPNTRRPPRPLDPATEGTPLGYPELAMTSAPPAAQTGAARGRRITSARREVTWRAEVRRCDSVHRSRGSAAEIREVREMSIGDAQLPAAGAKDLQATSLWWLFVVVGLIAAGVGIFFVASPHETLSTFTVIAGIFLLVDGALAIIASIFGHGEGRGLLAVIGVLSAIAGLILIKHPFNTLVFFTIIVGIWLVVAGIARFVTAFSAREGRGGSIAIAVVDVIAGAVILAWPDLGLSTLAVIIGIVLIIRGILFIAAGWELRKAKPDGVGAGT